MSSGYLLHVDDIFRRLSFSFNGQETKNSCTSVALGIALNYLDRTREANLVSCGLRSEDLDERRSDIWDSGRYPNTSALQHYLLDECNLKPGPLGRWGKGIARRMRRHYQVDACGHSPVRLNCTYAALNRQKTWQLIKEQIDQDIPVVVTTNLKLLTSKEFGQHTMAVCGYRENGQTGLTLIAHTGWYGGHVQDGLATLVDIPFSWVLCVYHFELKDSPQSDASIQVEAVPQANNIKHPEQPASP